MNPFPLLLVLLIAIPLAELWLLIQVGGWIGALPTIGLVVATAILGAFLLRQQGLSTLNRAQHSMQRGEPPALEMLEGLLLFFAAALLLTPGFFTDAIGFLLVLPPVRRHLVLALLARSVVIARSPTRRGGSTEESPPRRPGQGKIIEGEYERRDE